MLSAILAATLLGPLDLRRTAEVKFPALNEISGIVRSSKNEDWFWVHNDSGDSARIFAINAMGTVVSPKVNPYAGIKVEGAKNIDWEDIAVGGGNVYVSDLGNNDNKRKDLGVYVFPEPDATDATSVSKARFLPVIYPDQASFPPILRHFDCEAIFVFKGKLHVLTKHRLPGGFLPDIGTNVYRMDTSFTDKPNRLKKLDGKSNLKGWVTAADVSPDGRWLVVLTHMPVASVWIFDTKDVGDKLLSKPVRWVEIKKAKQCEAICFDGPDHLMIANEQRDLFRIKLTDVPKL
jgi:hypothetical protein